jgi:hypothetical protein
MVRYDPPVRQGELRHTVAQATDKSGIAPAAAVTIAHRRDLSASARVLAT